MALTTPQFQTWLESSNAKRCILVEVTVNIAGVDTQLYLSNKNYATNPSETPSSTNYLPYIQTSLSFTQDISLEGNPSISYGDLAIDNTNGIRDAWLNYIWANKPISIYIGDVNFARDDFTKIYSGYVSDIASSDRNTLNISIRDLLQRLNTPVTSATIGGSGTNKEVLKPLVFGEVYNIAPVLIDPANLIYMVHNGPIERIIEIRDNGVPLTLGTSYTVNLTAGTFTLLRAPFGTITCSVQGERTTTDALTGAMVSGTYTSTNVTWTRLGTTITVTQPSYGFTNGQTIYIAETSNALALPVGAYVVTVFSTDVYYLTGLNAGATSGTATLSTFATSVAKIIQVIISKYGTLPISNTKMDLATIAAFDLVNQAPVGIYLTNNTNVITVCQQLAASIGAQFTSNRLGQITLLKLDVPSEVGVTKFITDADIIAGSLSIEQKVPVQGAIKIGYSRNYTIQSALLTGIPETLKTLFATEYLTATASDSAVLTAYTLSSEPQIKNTEMISNSGIVPYVTNEANRLLTLWKTPRFVFTMECTAKFLTIALGEMVSLTHYRFGLSSSKYGQVVSVSTNWETGRVTLGILV